MDLQQYVQDAVRTESQIDQVSIDVEAFTTIAQIFIAAGNLLDDIKKNTYYGKPINPDKWNLCVDRIQSLSDNLIEAENTDNSTKKVIDINTRVFHSMIGIATEGTELIEAILTSLQKEQPLDIVNVSEEIGDVGWYQAIFSDAAGISLDNIFATNIAKLKHRYPDKFTSDKAINRDLETERVILENNQS